ncbi:MAG: response regulator transcription factor [Lachnospiraceae bacterium]|nr:response regulator transcription factor [Lachnospiraceae bacterium]
MFLINILLVDDHMLFAKSLSVALEEYNEIEHFYSTQDIQGIEKMVGNNNIDIVLMDINLGSLSDKDGLEIASNLLKSSPMLKIIVLTGYDLPVYRHEAKKIGISGFLNKNISPDDLISSLICVSHGNACFPFENEEIIIEDLTSMEKKILQLISNGKKRKCVADELYMSERTISNHLQHIFEKLDVSSAVEAVTKAIQLGYIPPIC